MPNVCSNSIGMLIIFSNSESVPNGIETLECTQEEIDGIMPTDDKDYTFYVDIPNKKIYRNERGSSLSLVQRIGVQEQKNDNQDVKIQNCDLAIMDISIKLYSVDSSGGSTTTPDSGGSGDYDQPGHN